MADHRRRATNLDAIGLSATDCARLCGVSRAHWWKLYASDRTPRPRRLGRRLVWDRREVEAWFAAACPAFDQWRHQWKGAAS